MNICMIVGFIIGGITGAILGQLWLARRRRKVKIIATVPANKLSRKQKRAFVKMVTEENEWQGRVNR